MDSKQFACLSCGNKESFSTSVVIDTKIIEDRKKPGKVKTVRNKFILGTCTVCTSTAADLMEIYSRDKKKVMNYKTKPLSKYLRKGKTIFGLSFIANGIDYVEDLVTGNTLKASKLIKVESSYAINTVVGHESLKTTILNEVVKRLPA